MGSQLAGAMIEATVCVGSGRRSSSRNVGPDFRTWPSLPPFVVMLTLGLFSGVERGRRINGAVLLSVARAYALSF